MIDNQLAGVSVTRENIQNSRRQAGVGRELGEQQRRERRELRGLDHDRASRGQGRCNLPGQHEQGEIPRDDLSDHANTAMLGKLGFQKLRPAGVMVEVPSDQWDVDVARFAN